MPNPPTSPAPTAAERDEAVRIARQVSERIAELLAMPSIMHHAGTAAIEVDLRDNIRAALASAEPERGAARGDARIVYDTEIDKAIGGLERAAREYQHGTAPRASMEAARDLLL